MTVLTYILTNKYFYILLFLIILNVVIKFYDKFPFVKKDQDFDEFLHSLHNYYVTNLYYELFMLVIYVLSYFGIFLLLRIRLLGNEINIMTITLSHFNTNVFITILLFILCIIFYINIINVIFYPHIIKLHYYFYHFEWYEILIDKCHMRLTQISDFISDITIDIKKYLWLKKEFNTFCYKLIESERICSDDPEIITKTNRNLKHSKTCGT